LINPNKVRLTTIPGTRILEEDFGLPGFQCLDPLLPGRVWTLQYLCAPVLRRRIGGVRAKFTDNKGFVTFCNQRDLEVLIGLAAPGSKCHWADTDYADVGEPDWFGFCVDEEDLDDDLLDRELRLREHYPGILPEGLQAIRRIHDGGSSDREELYMMLADVDVYTGYGPDPRLETIHNRWVRVERTKLLWELADT
jgi:hypothetical protein